ncbi:hypothetical protein C1645_838243 [Glomus cerebriforme]|uniref:Protein kinase domain-containing protein n=1 Tax=Glomus cerebriforme TaxID=658196 RepID=A0A397S2R6_9GLOM|nr:hypothetical protein C1645_838243 [Glomus cerebriforme]
MDLKMRKCEECKQESVFYWCNTCNTKCFQQNFKNWTSGNDGINKFIQHIQLSAKQYYKVLEWIPYDRLHDIKYIAKGGFGKILDDDKYKYPIYEKNDSEGIHWCSEENYKDYINRSNTRIKKIKEYDEKYSNWLTYLANY